MNRLIESLLLAWACVLSAALAGQAAAQDEWNRQLIAARKEGKVVLGTEIGLPAFRQEIVGAFAKRFGFDLELRLVGGAELSAVAGRECAAGRPSIDVLLGGNRELITLLPKGCLTPMEGEVPPPDVEARPEGPFGEWTGYYAPGGVPEPVLRVKALYHRNDPILFGAPPFKPHRDAYSFSLPMRTVTRLGDRLLKEGLPVRRVTDTVKMGAVVISVHQENEHDVDRVMKVIDKVKPPSRLFILVDDDVNPEDPLEVLWAVGTRFDPITGVRASITQSAWLLDPMRTTDQRAGHAPQPYKRLIINGCRPFERLKDFPPVNKLSEPRRRETWAKWNMSEWL